MAGANTMLKIALRLLGKKTVVKDNNLLLWMTKTTNRMREDVDVATLVDVRLWRKSRIVARFSLFWVLYLQSFELKLSVDAACFVSLLVTSFTVLS